MRRRRHGGKLLPLGGLVAKLFPAANVPTNALPEQPLSDMEWRRLVGLAISKRTRPMRISKGTLWVQVASAAWSQELSMLHDDLLARLALRGVSVERIRFKVGEIAKPAREPERVIEHYVPRTTLPEVLAQALAKVPDDGLRRAIEGAAATNLAWQDGIAISMRRVAPALPRVATESDRPGRTPPSGDAASRGKRGGS